MVPTLTLEGNSEKSNRNGNTVGHNRIAYLETLILKNFLDSSVLTIADKLCLKHNTEGSVANHFAVGVSQLVGLARFALVGHDLDDLEGI